VLRSPPLDRKHLERERLAAERELEEAERELTAANRLTEINRAAKRRARARARLQWVEDEEAKQQPKREA
jgi:hypothetical protein